MRKALANTGQILRRAVDAGAPQLHKKPTAPTARDYSTSGLAGAFAVVVIAALHDGAQIDLSPEVVAALTTVIGFFLARYFRY